MGEVGAILESRNVPVQVSQPPMQVRVTRSNISDIGLFLISILSSSNRKRTIP